MRRAKSNHPVRASPSQRECILSRCSSAHGGSGVLLHLSARWGRIGKRRVLAMPEHIAKAMIRTRQCAAVDHHWVMASIFGVPLAPCILASRRTGRSWPQPGASASVSANSSADGD